MIDLEATDRGVILPVQAQPKSRKNAIVGVHAGRLKVAVTQAPEKGKANEAVRCVLADELGIKHSQISLISGETAARKRFLISGTSLETLRSKISAHIGDEGN